MKNKKHITFIILYTISLICMGYTMYTSYDIVFGNKDLSKTPHQMLELVGVLFWIIWPTGISIFTIIFPFYFTVELFMKYIQNK